MPTSYPRDRFDDVPRQAARVGAHRAEVARTPRAVVLLWAVIATILLTIVGIVAFLVMSQRVDVVPEETTTPVQTVAPVVDTSYTVLVLNGTGTAGVAEEAVAQLVSAGWAEDTVFPADESSTTDFPTTTVYYASPEEEAAALGVAEAIGGAQVQQSDRYHDPEDTSVKELTVVTGLDRVSAE
ncbi:LytR C-terminal domain-containing protein [Microbacterium marinilacus]|uniref:LytR/CpsA/Psr regulator C-terminal domain-containing protein n=1 Tax=Microbacterium marinilacus TaxID=415209 RepID=A0ABP7BGX6_9MICO|nr:LytR C-terminal domain-containing protein [Microbacterium marinilacus]MBY0688937.1 LytR C-terminal domain-containing protein [Microbacterium marinilacus]